MSETSNVSVAQELLTDGFGRIRGLVESATDGLLPDVATYRPESGANSIAWLIWHLTRIQDDHVSDLAGVPQTWTEDGWYERFAVPFEATDTGYGHDREDVAAVQVSGAMLRGYHEAVHGRTAEYVSSLTSDELTRVVDASWDPPVTVAVRLVSVLADNLQHAGQAAYVRGIAKRLR